MSRPVVDNEDAARKELGMDRRQPAWLVSRHALPFQDLSDDEFEVFSYLLLLREHPNELVIYYGKTGDAGRDIVRTRTENLLELIQCKRFKGRVGSGEVRGELAKLCTNIFQKTIPKSPDRVGFYAVPDLTAPAKDLIANRDKWRDCCEEALKTHLGKKPPADLVEFGMAWWPDFYHEDEHKLTKRAQKHQDLIEEFFSVRSFVAGSLEDIKPELSAIPGMAQKIADIERKLEEVIRPYHESTSPTAPASMFGNVLHGSQAIQVQMLATKLSTLEDRDRQHLDQEGQRLISEIHGAIKVLDLHEAVAAGPRLESWLAEVGSRASASIRGQIAILLSDLAVIQQLESRGDGPIDTSLARHWFAHAMEELTSNSSPEYATRLVALDSKLMSLEGKEAEAEELAATLPNDPDCLANRLSTLINHGKFAEAAQAASGVPLHERWCDNLVVVYISLGDTSAAEGVVAEAKKLFNQQAYRRCLLALAQGRVHRVLESWPEAQKRLPPEPPDEALRGLQAALEDLRPISGVAEVNERVNSGLEAEAVACAMLCERLLGHAEKASAHAELLGTRMPVHLEYARAAFRGDVHIPTSLPDRLRRDHPVHFEARILAAILSSMSDAGGHENFRDVLEIVGLARTDTEKIQAVDVLVEMAAAGPDGAIEEAERVAGTILGAEHRYTRIAKALHLLTVKDADAAALVVEELRDEEDPLWLQLAAKLCFLLHDKHGALEHLLVASRVLVRSEVLERTALLALNLDRDEAAEEILYQLVRLRPRDVRAWSLLAQVSVRLGRHGQAARSFAALHKLEPHLPSHGVNYAKTLALSGRREEAIKVFDTVCAQHPHYIEALGGRAHLLDVLGRPGEALNTLTPVKETFWSDTAMLLLYLALGYRADREEEANLALARLLELKREGKNVPLQTFTLEELIEEMNSRRRAHEERNQLLLCGQFPWLAAGWAAGRPSLGNWASRTQELAALPQDPNGRAEFSVYSTHGWKVISDQAGERSLCRISACPPPRTTVVADLSALITLHNLGLLEHAARYFERVLFPASYCELELMEHTDYQPHQPSRLDAAREIRDAIDKGHILASSAADETFSLLDEYGNGPVYRLYDVITWLHEQGSIDEARAETLLGRYKDSERHPTLPPFANVAIQGLQTTVMTLEAAINTDVFATLVAATKLFLPTEEIREVRARIWASEHQSRLAQEHNALWITIQGDERFEQVEVNQQEVQEEGPVDWKTRVIFDAPLLAQARKLPLLVDDRAWQAAILNGWPNDPFPAFGTDCLLMALANSGAITQDQLADSFLRLVRWRYRFLVPPVRVLTTLAARHRPHPPGEPLREVCRYVHDCLADPGLLAGVEPTDRPVSIAWMSYRYWVQHVARFVVGLWNDERFGDKTAREFTAWAMGEFLPSPPIALPRMGAVVLCHSTAHLVVLTAYDVVSTFRNQDRAKRALSEVAASLRLTPDEYLEIAGNFLDYMSTEPTDKVDSEVSEASLQIKRIMALTAVSPVLNVDLRVFSALARLGVVTEAPAIPSPDELATILDAAHERRVAMPPGPIVFLRSPVGDRKGEAVCITDYLYHPARIVRETALRYFRSASQGPSGWLTPRSSAAIARESDSVLSEVLNEWLPATQRLVRFLEQDFLLNLAGFRQCHLANLQAEQDTYWRRVIRPGRLRHIG